jgi:hypothetical protein
MRHHFCLLMTAGAYSYTFLKKTYDTVGLMPMGMDPSSSDGRGGSWTAKLVNACVETERVGSICVDTIAQITQFFLNSNNTFYIR